MHFSIILFFSLKKLPDIICIQETFLKRTKKFSLSGYTVIRKDRISASRGGVLTLVHRSISYAEISSNPESIGIQINSSEGLIDIYNIYIPPDSDYDISLLENMFSARSVVCRDFNAHHPMWGGSKLDDRGLSIENTLLKSHHVYLINDGQGTYTINHEKTSALDLNFVHKNLALNPDWYVVDDDLGCDHFPVSITLNSFPIKETSTRSSLNINRVNWDCFSNYMQLYILTISNLTKTLKLFIQT